MHLAIICTSLRTDYIDRLVIYSVHRHQISIKTLVWTAIASTDHRSTKWAAICPIGHQIRSAIHTKYCIASSISHR